MKKESRFRSKVAANTQKQKQAQSNYGHLHLPKGVNVFKEDADAKTYLDIIPYVVTDENHLDRDEQAGVAVAGNKDTELWYKKPYRLHKNIGSEKKNVICPTTWGKKCPVCEYKAAQLKEGVDYDEVKDLKPSLRNIYYVVPRGMKEFKEEPYIWDISQFLFQEMLNDEIQEDENNLCFPDPESGLTLKIRFTEKKFGGFAYAETARIDFEEREEQYDEDMIYEMTSLDEVIQCPSYEEVYALFYDTGSDDDKSQKENEPEKPKRSFMKRRTEDSKEEDSKEEETQEKPERKRKTIRKDDEDEKQEKPEQDIQIKKDENTCVACEGTGVSSKGTPCRICDGTGVKPEKADIKKKENAPAPKEEKAQKKEPSGKCPFGYEFGVDTDSQKECDTCNKWDDCIEEKENK